MKRDIYMTFLRLNGYSYKSSHIKDLKTSNVQHSYEILTRLSGVQGLVDSHHHPQKHLLID